VSETHGRQDPWRGTLSSMICSGNRDPLVLGRIYPPLGTCAACGNLADEADPGPCLACPACGHCFRCGYPVDGHLHLSRAGSGVPKEERHGWPL